MRIQARSLRLLGCCAGSILGAALLISRPLLADTAESGIEVSLTPVLDVVASEDGAKVFAVSAGAVVQLTVSVKLSDGTARDVTHDAATSYVSLNPEIATVDPNGRFVVTESLPTTDTDVLVVVDHGDFTAPVAFRVTAN